MTLGLNVLYNFQEIFMSHKSSENKICTKPNRNVIALQLTHFSVDAGGNFERKCFHSKSQNDQ